MRKLLLSFSLILLVFLLIACQNNGQEPVTTDLSDVTEAEITTPVETKIAETKVETAAPVTLAPQTEPEQETVPETDLVTMESEPETVPEPEADTEAITTEPMTAETAETAEPETQPREYESGEWPDAGSLGFESSEYECQVGVLYDDFDSIYVFNPDRPYGSKYYNLEVKVQDPDIVDVISYDKYSLLSGIGEGLIVRGLKPGTTTLTVTMIYIPTGGSEDTTVTVKVVEANDEETAPVVDESGDVWNIRFPQVVGQYAYEIQTGEVFDSFEISFECSDCKFQYHPTNCDYHGIGYAYDDYSFDIVSENPEILEIVSYNKYTIMNAELTGGITVKGLKAGETRIKLTMTHIPTGKTYTDFATVNVVDTDEITD